MFLFSDLLSFESFILQKYNKIIGIHFREGRCLLGLKQHGSALQVFKETLRALDLASSIQQEKKHKLEYDLQIMIAMLIKNNAQNGQL